MSDTGIHTVRQDPRTKRSPQALTLRVLAPGALAPARCSARAQVTAWLNGIDHIHVREAIKHHDGKRYVVDVYRKRAQNNIPAVRPAVARSHQTALRGRHAPAIIMERRFSEFSRLLTDLYGLAEQTHGLQRRLRCAFCVPVMDYVLQGQRAPSGVGKWFLSDASVCAQLTTYTNNLVEIVRRVPSHEGHSDCYGAQHAPELMKRFLCGDDDERDERSHLSP